MKNIFLNIGLLICLIANLEAQNNRQLHIHVLGAYEADTTFLEGANVFWVNSTQGASTNEKGIASLNFHEELPNQIIITYVGLQTDTLTINAAEKSHYYVFLLDDALLETIEISSKKQASFISSVNPIRSDFLGQDELKKAACCDLSESFETNAAVDVNYSDGVTGAKEIKLLGLDGTYVEMLEQNVPALRGLAVPFGLSYVPGPWLNSISISKGAGSILTGHESITGTINYQYKQPFETNPFELDIFGNHLGRYEVNALTGFNINKNVGSVVAVNVGGQPVKHDQNKDGFIDIPLYNRVNIMNRWKFLGENRRGQLSVNYLFDDRMGGQESFSKSQEGSEEVYGFGMKTNRFDAYGKTAFFFKNNDNQNIGLVYAANYHDQKGFFGTETYLAEQISFNSTLLFQSIIKTKDHGIVVGGNIHVDKYDESFQGIVLDDLFWNLGVFAEYTFCFNKKLNIVTGLRLDYHQQFKLQFTPRIHMKYAPNDNTSFRLSAGRGFRNARVLGENISLMASSRDFIIEELPGIEAAWNTGISLVQKFTINGLGGHLAIDYYHTNFQNQVISDVNAMDNAVRFYNLKGKSYANSFLTEFSLEVFEGLQLKLAYKLDDVKTTFKGDLETKPFTYLHKGLLVANYETKNKEWQFDANFDMHGKHRLPASFAGDAVDSFSPFFIQLGVQVSKNFKKGMELYIGGENITNYRQPNPIIGADNPFGNRFDSAQIWGPITGGIFYLGFRYNLKNKNES